MIKTMLRHRIATQMIVKVMVVMVTAINAADTNEVFDPCSDALVQKSDGFTFGLAFSDKDSFFSDQVQPSPCDSRLALASKKAKLAVFRPLVDEISLLSVNSSTPDSCHDSFVETARKKLQYYFTFPPSDVSSPMSKNTFQGMFGPLGSHMVAFAGRKYAARSFPVMIADNAMIVTSFTLVLEFQKGTLQNLYWKKFGCQSCSKDFVCLNGQDCALPLSKCKGNGGASDCNLSIQLTFSGTDKNLEALNSWYEVSNLRQYSLYGLYSRLIDSSHLV
uniref:Expp1 protein n=1 Tax=Salix viminalis TaxID=40686 RepID=A0A6N2LAI2_SALVM